MVAAGYDAEGNFRDWWTEADAKAFDSEAQKLIDQANAFEVLPGLNANGPLNVRENMADVGGITLAYESLMDYLAEHPEENVEIDGLSPAKRCFIGWAQFWTAKLPTRSCACLSPVTGILRALIELLPPYSMSMRSTRLSASRRAIRCGCHRRNG